MAKRKTFGCRVKAAMGWAQKHRAKKRQREEGKQLARGENSDYRDSLTTGNDEQYAPFQKPDDFQTRLETALDGFRAMLLHLLQCNPDDPTEHQNVLRSVMEFPDECAILGVDFETMAIAVLREVTAKIPPLTLAQLIRTIGNVTIEYQPEFCPNLWEHLNDSRSIRHLGRCPETTGWRKFRKERTAEQKQEVA